MLKLEFPNEEFFIDPKYIEGIDKNEDFEYFAIDETYNKVEYISLSNKVSFAENTKINAPNLKGVFFEPNVKREILDNFDQIFINSISLEDISLYLDKTHSGIIPQFILNSKTIKNLTIEYRQLTSIPAEIFNITSLKRLNFRYVPKIKIIPDEIKKLINLEDFSLWLANLEYISLELFKLPKLDHINLAYSNYNPTGQELEKWNIFFQGKDFKYENPFGVEKMFEFIKTISR